MKDIKLFTPVDLRAKKNEITEFVPQKVESKERLSDYNVAKSKYGPLALTDPDRKRGLEKSAGFALNPATRDRLSIDQEEQKQIDSRVQARISELSKSASEVAKKAGYDEGFKSGYAEGYKKAREDAGSHIQQLNQFLESSENAKVEIVKANERLILETIFQVCRMVLLKEITQDREYLLRLCRNLIEKLDARENIRVQVNQTDLDSMGKLREYLQTSLGELKNLNIEVSDRVSAGGIVVDTQWGAIEANIEAQLKGIHDALVGETHS